LHLHLFNFL